MKPKNNTPPLIRYLTLAVALLVSVLAFSISAFGQATLILSGTNYVQDFNAIESGLPDGWSIRTGATVSSPGSLAAWATVNSSPFSNTWAATSGRFANQASTISNEGTNFLGTETGAIQAAATNRALAIRQTGTVGDPGGAFVLRIQDTVGFGVFMLSLDFENLNPQTRQTIYTVDYAVGNAPSSFIPVGTYTNYSTVNGGVFGATNMTLSFGNTLDDQAENVWIRVVTLSATTGSGNRPTFGIDNFNLGWTNVPSVPKPPTIVSQPQSRTNNEYTVASFTAAVSGTAPFTYQWKKAGADVFDGPTGSGATISGANTATLTISSVRTAEAGNYSVGITNSVGGTNSQSAALTVNPVVAVATNIAYLRTLVNTEYVATNSTAVWQATGTVTTFTNLTAANTSSYYLQDSTAGINIFMTLGATFRPAQGDVVTFTGVLSSFNGTLELLADAANNPLAGATVLSNSVASLPAPKVIPFGITNNIALCETNLEASIVMLTNVYFGTNAGLAISTGNMTVPVTNAAGETFALFFSAQDLDTAGQILPESAFTIVGPLTQSGASYTLTVTRFSDMVTNPIVVSASHSGSTTTLSWPAAPYSYSYGVEAAVNVEGPYLPLTNNVHFTDPSGTFIDSAAGGSQKFYRVKTP